MGLKEELFMSMYSDDVSVAKAYGPWFAKLSDHKMQELTTLEGAETLIKYYIDKTTQVVTSDFVRKVQQSFMQTLLQLNEMPGILTLKRLVNSTIRNVTRFDVEIRDPYDTYSEISSVLLMKGFDKEQVNDIMQEWYPHTATLSEESDSPAFATNTYAKPVENITTSVGDTVARPYDVKKNEAAVRPCDVKRSEAEACNYESGVLQAFAKAPLDQQVQCKIAILGDIGFSDDLIARITGYDSQTVQMYSRALSKS